MGRFTIGREVHGVRRHRRADGLARFFSSQRRARARRQSGNCFSATPLRSACEEISLLPPAAASRGGFLLFFLSLFLFDSVRNARGETRPSLMISMRPRVRPRIRLSVMFGGCTARSSLRNVHRRTARAAGPPRQVHRENSIPRDGRG